jgi:hypothetical protein
MLKRALLSVFVFAGIANAHPSLMVVRHPQADVNYTCQVGQTLDNCIDIACSYSTEYGCRMIGQSGNIIFIETYISPYYRQPSPTVIVVPQQSAFVLPFIPIVMFGSTNNRHNVIHRQNSIRPRHHNQRRR